MGIYMCKYNNLRAGIAGTASLISESAGNTTNMSVPMVTIILTAVAEKMLVTNASDISTLISMLSYKSLCAISCIATHSLLQVFINDPTLYMQQLMALQVTNNRHMLHGL